MHNSLIEKLSSPAIQAYLRDHENEDEAMMALRGKEVFGVSPSILAGQIAARRKAKTKLPVYYNTAGIVYPPVRNLEQSSSEATAVFRAQKISGERTATLIDLTGGFGVDSFFFSRKFSRVIYVEPDAGLVELAQHNHRLLGQPNIEYINTTAEKFLVDFAGRADFIFVDPSRRPDTNRRVITFADSLPDILGLMDKMRGVANSIVIKAAPMLDISAAVSELPGVSTVQVIAVDNECKELVFTVEQEPVAAVMLQATNLGKSVNEEFDFFPDEENSASFGLSAPLEFLYEPNAAIMKAGAFRLVARRFGLQKLDTNTHLYTGHKLIEDFPGRIFRPQSLLTSDAAMVQRQIPDRKANVLTRNYPISADELKRKLKITDGGDHYIIGTTALGKRILIHATRLR